MYNIYYHLAMVAWLDPVEPAGHGAVHVAHGADQEVLGVVGAERGGLEDADVVSLHGEQVFTG